MIGVGQAVIGAAAGGIGGVLAWALADRLCRTAAGHTRLHNRVVVGVAVALAAATGTLLALLVEPGIAVGGYGIFATGILAAALVDVAEMRLPDLITLPLIGIAVAGLPWLITGDGWDHARPILGLLAAGAWALLIALLADQSLGDVKLAAAIGGWLAWHSWLTLAAGVMVGQVLVAAAIGIRGHRRRRAGLPVDDTPLGPLLAAGAVLGLALGMT